MAGLVIGLSRSMVSPLLEMLVQKSSFFPG